MNVVQGLLEQLTTALGITVLHSLWQCALVGTLAALLMLVLRGANKRYIVWCVSMLLCAAWMLLTFIDAMWPSAVVVGGAGELGIGRSLSFSIIPASPEAGTVLLEIVAWLWAGGFVFSTVRFAQQWGSARRLRTQGIVAFERHWLDLFDEIRTGLGVSRRVGLLVSTRVQTPMVVGWLSPVVILPMSALSMLSPEQVRLVLVHELAHIRRFDHIVNILQVLIETVLFYHPVVWWMSHQARMEREHCCDDAAVFWAGNAVEFTRALAELETSRTQTRAVLALNHGGSLMNRISRILGTSDHRWLGNGSLRTLAALTAGTLVAGAGIANAAMRAQEPREGYIEVIRANVNSGVMTAEQARRIFDTVIYPGSEMQLKMDAYVDEIEAKINAAVDAGKMSQEQSKARLQEAIAVSKNSLDRYFSTTVLGMTKSELELWTVSVELREQVDSGQITQQQADAKLAWVARGLRIAAAGEEHIKSIGIQVNAQIEAGELTPEEGREKMAEEKRDIELRMKFIELEHRIDQAVEAGEMTREEADAKVEAVRVKMGEAQQGVLLKLNPVTRSLEGKSGQHFEIKVEPIGTTGKLTPMDESYWYHQGIRPLSAYDETFGDDC